MLSIRPEFVAAILRGEKQYEFRRRLFRRPVEAVVVYATAPVGRVVGEFSVKSIITDSPRRLWEMARDAAGIDEKNFFAYFAGKRVGHAIKIGRVRRYRSPFRPVERLGIKPPQSFAYLPAGR